MFRGQRIYLTVLYGNDRSCWHENLRSRPWRLGRILTEWFRKIPASIFTIKWRHIRHSYFLLKSHLTTDTLSSNIDDAKVNRMFVLEKTTSQIIKMTKYGKPNIKASVLNGIIQLFYLSTWRFVHLNKKGKDKHWMC